MRVLVLIAVVFCLAAQGEAASTEKREAEKKRKNVLLVIVDDMRAEATPFHDKQYRPWLYDDIETPNIQRLAGESFVFRKAYAQVARCNPSRSSFMTSRRSDTIQVHTNGDFFRENTRSHLITLPEFFKNKGYNTGSIGKVFHTLRYDMQDNDYSWTECSIPVDPIFNSAFDYSWYGVSDEKAEERPFGDILLRDKVLKRIDKYADSDKNFFLALGFQRPHLPFTVPQRFLDMYKDRGIKPAKHDRCAQNMPDIAWGDGEELMHYGDIKKAVKDLDWKANVTMPEDQAIAMRIAYYACITYIDEMLGNVLDKLEASGLKENTVIAFMGDHGFHLGENGVWGKNTVLETALHVPLMFHVPGLTEQQKQTEKLAELVDVYPTLVEAAGFEPPPTCPHYDSDEIDYCTEGHSVMPLIRGEKIKWKEAVFSQSQYPLYARNAKYNGYSMRTAAYRYTEWVENPHAVPINWPDPVGVELYDLVADPNQTINRASDKKYKAEVERLSKMLHGGWKAVYPE